MARVTVYVPDQLKSRMDACGEAVNWSAEAQAAFERAVAREGWKMIDLDEKQRAIARLRASKAEFEIEERKEGEEAGRHWALHRADYAELERLLAYEGEADAESVESYMTDNLDYAFWDDGVQIEGYPNLSPAFVHAFINGAHAVYRELASEL